MEQTNASAALKEEFTLTCYKPQCAELWFKQRMMADEETMSYNHAWGGTLPFPEEKWADWYERWVAHPEGKRYYRYLKDAEGALIGEHSYHFDEDAEIYLADIVIFAPYRRRGYGAQALKLLCAKAREDGISDLYDEIALDNPAIGLFRKNGFEEVGRTEHTILLKKELSVRRCFWCNRKNPLYIAYHDKEWGVFPESEQKLYECFILETFQAGLSWECILNKRENFRAAYDGFDLDAVCAYGEEKIEELAQNPGIIRHRGKITASIRNSRIYKSILEEFGSFRIYLESFTGGKIIRQDDIRITTNPLSDTIAADLKKRGISYMGSTTVYAFLQAVGMIQSHEKDCFCYKETALRAQCRFCGEKTSE